MALKAPKFGFRAPSEFFTRQGLQYSLKTGRPFLRPICTREAFDAEWRARCTPLKLAPPVTAGSPPSSGRSWPIASWVNYVQSRNALPDCTDWSHSLMFIVRGDAFFCAGGSWSHLGIALASHSACARQPAYYWVIGMAVCADKDMAQLGAIWNDNLHVWFARTCSYSVSLPRRSNLNVQISNNVQERAELPKFRFLDLKKDF